MPAENYVVELTVGVNERLRGAYSAFSLPIDDDPLMFRWSLFRKPVKLHATSFHQYWMHPTSIYGQRNQSGLNGQAMADYFWATCLADESAALESEQQETFLLAKLLPFVRSTGSRRAFVDARTSRAQSVDLAELNEFLDAGKLVETSIVDFQRQSGVLLGPPNYNDQATTEYLHLSAELLDAAAGQLIEQPQLALESVRSRWTEWMRTVGRRTGNEIKKQVLDALSYECRASMHRCYSLTWHHFLRRWAELGQMSDQAIMFHRLWHLEIMDNHEGCPLPNGHLFHGHIFGLHPAGSSFIQTATGHNLIGEWLLTAPGTAEFDTAFRRLLNGLMIAICQFSERREEHASYRRQPDLFEGRDVDRLRLPVGQRARKKLAP